jgi:pimeloyl-ACP methyl ester carboxylesterase
VLDVAAAADLATRTGAKQFITIGHSFGGAVALQVGIILGEHCAGVVTLSTQSAGCEAGAALGTTPLLLLHGDRDEILPPDTSAVVQMIVGHGDLVILPGTGHLLTEAHAELRSDWARIPERFAETA